MRASPEMVRAKARWLAARRLARLREQRRLRAPGLGFFGGSGVAVAGVVAGVAVLLGWMAHTALRSEASEEQSWIARHGHELHGLLDDARSSDEGTRERALKRYMRLTESAPVSIRRKIGRA